MSRYIAVTAIYYCCYKTHSYSTCNFAGGGGGETRHVGISNSNEIIAMAKSRYTRLLLRAEFQTDVQYRT